MLLGRRVTSFFVGWMSLVCPTGATSGAALRIRGLSPLGVDRNWHGRGTAPSACDVFHRDRRPGRARMVGLAIRNRALRSPGRSPVAGRGGGRPGLAVEILWPTPKLQGSPVVGAAGGRCASRGYRDSSGILRKDEPFFIRTQPPPRTVASWRCTSRTKACDWSSGVTTSTGLICPFRLFG